MSKIADVEANATSLDGLVNDNALIPTLRNGPKPSYQYLVDGWNAEIADKIDEVNKSRGFRVVGTFADGFTYELFNDVGIDVNGDSWIYVGTGAPDKVVSAGTVPSSPDYQQVTYNDHNSTINRDQEGAHPASAISLAVKAGMTVGNVSLQDAADWYGVYLSEFIEPTDQTLSPAINRAISYCKNLPYLGTKIVFPRGDETNYKYDDNHYLDTLSHCYFDLNGCTLTRRNSSSFSSLTTTLIPSGIGLTSRTFTVEDASKFKVGDSVYCIKTRDLAGTSSDPREITSISGNEIVVASAFFFGGTGTGYDSDTPVGAKICKKVFLLESPSSFLGMINDKIFVSNGTIDGNSANQPSNAWVFNTELLLNSNSGLITGVTFKNIAAECIVGHGVNVTKNQFFDLQGSAFHTSANDNALSIIGGSSFTYNQCERTNLATQAVSGHAEGLITFSWGAGRLVVHGNICKGGVEGFMGAFGSPEESNPDRMLVVTSNIVENFGSSFYYLAPDAEGVIFANNCLRNTPTKAAVNEVIKSNRNVKFYGNTDTDNPTGKMVQLVSGDTANIGTGDVNIGNQLFVVSSTGDISSTPNPAGAQNVVSGTDVLSALRCSSTAFHRIYTAEGAAAGTVLFGWDESIGAAVLATNKVGADLDIHTSLYEKAMNISGEGVALSQMGSGKATYYGDRNADGSWRVIIIAGDLVHQKRVDGSWVTKQTVSGA